MQDEKPQKVLDFPLPQYVKQLSSFIGLAEYFRSYVYGDILEIMRLMKKVVSKFQASKSKIKWDDMPGSEQSFHTTKEFISMKPKLLFYDETAPTFY